MVYLVNQSLYRLSLVILILSVYDCSNCLKVGQIVSFYKIPLKQVLVVYFTFSLTHSSTSGFGVHMPVLKNICLLQVYDDLDLPFGKLRLLPKGGHGGHNGYKAFHPISDLFKDVFTSI